MSAVAAAAAAAATAAAATAAPVAPVAPAAIPEAIPEAPPEVAPAAAPATPAAAEVKAKPVIRLRRALNGCNGGISVRGLPVYHEWDAGAYEDSILGSKADKPAWIDANITDASKKPEVTALLAGWDLYDHGWVHRGSNKDLYYYLCQIGDYGMHRPPAFDYLSPLNPEDPRGYYGE